MTKCIICLNETTGSKEHIIPFSLGNTKLITYRVCTECNVEMGKHIDAWLIHYPEIRAMRFLHSLPGHKGKVPSLFDKTIDEHGKTVLWYNNLNPRIVPKLIKRDGARIVFANSEEEAYEMTKKIWNEIIVCHLN